MEVQIKKVVVMEELQQKQAKECIEIVTKHKVNEDKFSAKLTEGLKKEPNSATTKLDQMEKLWEVQRDERNTLRMHQTRELQS